MLEGFYVAEKQHDVCYTNFIGDGADHIERKWRRNVTKQEHANHVRSS